MSLVLILLLSAILALLLSRNRLENSSHGHHCGGVCQDPLRKDHIQPAWPDGEPGAGASFLLSAALCYRDAGSLMNATDLFQDNVS